MRITISIIMVMFSFLALKAQESKHETLPVGAAAPDFDLPGVDGRNYQLEDFNSYPILIVLFTCNHCPTGQAYEDKVIQMVDKYQSEGVGWVAISPNDPTAVSLAELGYSDLNDDLESMKLRAQQKGYNFPYLYDGENQLVSKAYGPAATPHAFVFDSQRKLVYTGRIDDTENPYVSPNSTDLVNAIDALLDKKLPPVASTKTFGCSIKWASKNEWTRKLSEEWSKEPVSLEKIDKQGLTDLLANKTNNYLLINVWATWCGPCIIEFPEFVNINRMYRNRNFEFISLSTDKINNKDKALDFLKKKQASNRNFIYTEGVYELIELIDKDWQGALPYTLLVKPGGEIVYKVDGTIDPFTLKHEIVKHLGRYYADNPSVKNE